MSNRNSLNESFLREKNVSHIIQLMHSFEVNIRICRPEKVMSTATKGSQILILTSEENIICFVMTCQAVFLTKTSYGKIN